MLPGFAGIAGTISPRFVTYQELKTDTVGASTYTFSAATIGTAVAGRVVIVGVTWFNDTARTLSSATIGGVSASILVQTGANGTIAVGSAIIAAVVPTGTTADVVVNMSGSTGGCAAGVWTASGLQSAAAFATGSNTTLAALGVSTSPAGFLIAVAANDNTRTFTWTGATENYDSNYDGTAVASGASIAAVGGTVTVTPTASGAATGCLVAASF